MRMNFGSEDLASLRSLARQYGSEKRALRRWKASVATIEPSARRAVDALSDDERERLAALLSWGGSSSHEWLRRWMESD